MKLEFFQTYYNIISFFSRFFFLMQYLSTKILKNIYFFNSLCKFY